MPYPAGTVEWLGMRLRDYLTARAESVASFARRAGMPQQTVSDLLLLRGGVGCRASTAARVIAATREEPAPDGGTVTLLDLVTPEARPEGRRRAG